MSSVNQEELPQVSSQLLEAADNEKAKLVAFDQQRVNDLLKGIITLGEFEGISKEQQYRVAELGYDFLQQGKIDDAEKLFEGLMALDPYDAYFWMVLGTIALERSNYDVADARFTRSLEINPYFAPAKMHRGETRLHQGRLMEAITDLTASVQLDSEREFESTTRALALLGGIKHQAQELDAADASKTSDAAVRADAVE